MLRLVGFLSAGAVLLLATGASSATSPLGTWKILPKLNSSDPPGLPWADGKQTVTVRSSSKGEVEGLWSATSDVATYYCGTSAPQDTEPTISGWFTATFSWNGAGVGGCTSNRTTRQGDPYIEASGPGGRVALGITRDIFYGCFEGGQCFQAVRDSKSTTKTVDAPAPGKSTSVSSPPLPATGKVDVTVSSSKDDLDDLTIFGEGDVEALLTVVWIHCYVVRTHFQPPKEAVRRCGFLIAEWLRDRGYRFRGGARSLVGSKPSRVTAAGGCTTKGLAFRAQLQKKSKKTITSLRQGSKKPTANSVRYSCTLSELGMRITLQTNQKGGLRKALGKTLDLGVFRSKTAAKGGKLTFTFGW